MRPAKLLKVGVVDCLSVGIIGFLRIATAYRAMNSEHSSYSYSVRPPNLLADTLYITDIWLCIQLGLSVVCCCLPTYGPILPKESMLKPARNLCSKLMSKIITPVTSRAKSERGSESQKVSGLKPRFRRPDNLNDGEADGVGLTRAAGDFELAEENVAGRDFAISVKSTVEMI